MNTNQTPQIIHDLVERFERNYEAYKSGSYNETQVRREFIDPFFEALGWDVNNSDGNAEAYKDVIHEDAVKVGGVTKAPDYSFRIGGTRKFFVEAKKPSIVVKDDPAPAFQVRRYAWSAKLPLSIVTDFEELAVYDCRIKPDQKDKADKARVKYYTFRQYVEKWDEIDAIFSKQAILKGSFDKYAESHKAKRGTAEVDSAFLEEIESWRDTLARNIALRNTLNVRELNESVQRTIDRIIFLRIAEDRGIEEYGSLRGICNGPNTFARLRDLFYKADDRYNSGLFHFRHEKGEAEPPDSLTISLAIDDKPLKDILKRLYYPDSPYEFAVLPADILGQVYEQFLGKVIRLTSDHRAVVEDKPEVKKAGGVFYTPTYIVEYIVKNTVGRLVGAWACPALVATEIKSGRAKAAPLQKPITPSDVSKLRILDPACGSGSFLLGAYQYLLDWHLAWYVDNDPGKWAKAKKPAVHKGKGDTWHLTTAERKRILLNNIYGVDIDSQAVEVTKLSLLLKVLEGETGETLNQQMRLFHERALPDLGSNIKCGNSLIGPDFYDGRQMNLMADEEMYRVNVFDWEREFAEVFKAGGFDCIAGNPPYGYMISGDQQQYFSEHYNHQDNQKDLYLLFLERYEILLKNRGLLGIIISNTWLQSVTLRKIRQYMANHYFWLDILHLPEKVFRAVVDTHVLIFEKGATSSKIPLFVPIHVKLGQDILLSHELSWHDIPKNGDPINIVANSTAQDLYRRITSAACKLSAICNVFNGVKPFEKGKGTPPQTEQTMKEKPFVREGSQPDKSWSPLLRGSLIHRYRMLWDNNYWIQYGPWLAAPRSAAIFEAPRKIMVRQTGDSIIATCIEDGFIARNNLHILLPNIENYSLEYLLGLLNSKLMDFVYSLMNPEKGEALAEVKKQHVEQLSIRTIDFSDPSDKALHDRMVQLVEQVLSLYKQLPNAKTGHDKTHLQRQIDASERQIDKLVYELYGLTEEEIAVVEGRV